jgi:hypothetical protein
MNKSVLALIVLASLAAAAAAQTAQAPLDVFLEQRVAEELTADGTMLSRLGVALDIEAVGDKLLVSLVDPATRRVVASTKVDRVPTDREAAVAAITQVAANLVAQLGTAPVAVPTQSTALADLKRHTDAEYRYRQEMVTFEREFAISGNKDGVSTRRWTVPVKGELKRPLEGRDFYLAVDRPDLAAQYSARSRRIWYGLLGGAAVGIGGLAVIGNASDLGGASECDYSAPSYNQCEADNDRRERPFALLGGGMMLAGAVGMIVGGYYVFNRHPVAVSEWYDLAAQHNANVRRKYGLTAERRARRQSTGTIVVAPYALGDGGGLSVAGRF